MGKCGCRFNYVGVGKVGRHPGNNGEVRASRNERTSECSTRSITRVYAPTHTVARTFTFNTGSIPTDSQPRPPSLPPRSTLCRPFLTASSMSSILHCHSLPFSHSLVFLFLFPRSPSDTKQSRALRALFHLPLRLIVSVRAETRDGTRRNYMYTEMYIGYLTTGMIYKREII